MRGAPESNQQATAMRDLRESLNLTQEKVAQLTGLSTATVQNIEYGKPSRSRPKVEAALLRERIRQSGIRIGRLAELMDVEPESVERAVAGDYMGAPWIARAHTALIEFEARRSVEHLNDPGEGQKGSEIA